MKKIDMMNISPVLSIFQSVLKTGEMLIMLILIFQKVAKTREMLIMIIMLIFWGLWGGGGDLVGPPPNHQSPQQINLLDMINISPVLATFQNMKINMINISPVLSMFSQNLL